MSIPHADAPARYEPPSRLPWMILLLAVLFGAWVLPYLAERVQYSITRGRERAEVEMARSQLPSPSLEQISRESALIAKAIGPSVVHIDTLQLVQRGRDEWSDVFSPRFDRALGQGSGVVVDEAGYILTNYHVVENVREIRVKLSDNETRPGSVMGADPVTDLAVVKIAPGGLIAAPWGDSDALPVGALVWAVGNPFGLDRSVTMGIISAKNRRGLGRASPYQDFLQTDAAVNPGNSGGPLVDAGGRVIGINTAIVGQAYQGISFSIPSTTAQDVYERLRANGKIDRGFLGVRFQPVTPELAKQLGLESVRGALVGQVGDNSPASRADIRPGDVIVTWNGHTIADAAEMALAVGKTPIGSKATASLLRDGQKIDVEVEVGARP